MMLAHRIIEEKWIPKFEFALHGEPLMNPDHVKIFGIFREYVPNTSMLVTSNGGPLLKGDVTDNIDSIMEHVNVLAIDDYKHVNFVQKIKSKYKGKYEIQRYPQVQPYQKMSPKFKAIIVFPDVMTYNKGLRRIHNFGGIRGLDLKYLATRCARPFREMTILWDGMVVLCCMDWRRYFRIGNIWNKRLEHLWNDKYMKAARRQLFHVGRDFSICYGCNNFPQTVGLLPVRGKDKRTVAKPSRLTSLLLRQKENEGSDITVYNKLKPVPRMKGIMGYLKGEEN